MYFISHWRPDSDCLPLLCLLVKDKTVAHSYSLPPLLSSSSDASSLKLITVVSNNASENNALCGCVGVSNHCPSVKRVAV